MKSETKILSKEATDLINFICADILENWKVESYRLADETGESFQDFFHDEDHACDFYSESLWEYEDKVPLNLALEIMSYFSEKLEWDFFFTLVNTLPEKLEYKNYSSYGSRLFKQQALILIDGYYLRDYFKRGLIVPKPKAPSCWKGTLDPDKINWIGQIPPEYRKDNRNDLYTRHPCG